MLELPVTLKLALPVTPSPEAPSFYIFNLYRSASSLIGVAARALAKHTDREQISVMRQLYDLGISFFPDPDGMTSSMHLGGEDGSVLAAIGQINGYVFSGLREVPIGFSTSFQNIEQSILFVRDIRDIGISHYFAVQKHVTNDAISRKHILKSREQRSRQSLEEYLASPEMTVFLKRIGDCYLPLIQKGIKVVRYEDLFRGESFDLDALCRELHDHFGKLTEQSWSYDALLTDFKKMVDNSDALKGHATHGTYGKYKELDSWLIDKLTDELCSPLSAFGYI